MSYRVMAIGAWDRSGSTILAQLLGSVPGVVSVGELNNLWQRGVVEDRLCSCGRHFSACPFWSAVMETAFPGDEGRRILQRVVGAADHMSNQRMLARRLMPGRVDQFSDTYGDGLSRLYDAISLVSGAEVIVDSAKIPWHIDVGRHLLKPRQVVVHLIRDPRGVVFSHRKVVAYDTSEASPQLMSRHGVAFTTAGWCYRNLLLSWLWRNEGSYVPVLYEEFAHEPVLVVDRVLDMVGLRAGVSRYGDAVTLDVQHNISGNPVRFASGPISIRVDEGWRTGLHPVVARLVGATTWPLRVMYRRSARRWLLKLNESA
jgi:hypothetical protein